MDRFRELVALSMFIAGSCLTGCRTTRPEVPPPPKFTADGRKQPLSPVGFGSSPKAGYMTDASSQIAPGIKAPGQEQTSIASRDSQGQGNAPKDSILNIPDREMPAQLPVASASNNGKSKGLSLGGLMKGLGNGSSSNRDPAVQRAGATSSEPPSEPLEPPVTLPPPPLVPPPSAAIPPPLPTDGRAISDQAPAALPSQNVVPPLTPEPLP